MNPWHTPQLVELVRGRPEEALLQICKTASPGAGPTDSDAGCFSQAAGGPCGPSPSGVHLNAIICSVCSATAAS